MLSTAQPLSLIYELPSILEPLDLRNLFATPQPLEVELGSGDGSFLIEYARKHPERNFIGVERLLGRLGKLQRKARRAGLANVRGLRIESSYFLRYLLPCHTAAVLHVYFPDPWPKRKHRRHRLLNSEFPAIAHRSLIPAGTLYVRTDDADYHEQILQVFDAGPLFVAVPTPAALSAVCTDFEKEFRARGVKTLYAAYQSHPVSAP